MADNVAITAGSGTTIAADDVGGVLYQRNKLALGVDGSATDAVGGAGVVDAGTQRVTLASDDPAVTALQVVDDWDESDRAKVNLIVGQAGVAAGAGAVGATVQRVTLASDDPAVASLAALDNMTINSTGTVRVGGLVTNPSANFTRPADTTAYATGDLVANSTTAGSVSAMSFTVTAVSAGSFQVRRVKVHASNTSTTNANFRLHLFRTAPATITNGDNGAYSVSGVSDLIESIDVTLDRAHTDGAVGTANCDIAVKLASGTTIVGLLEARGAYTPTSAQTFTVTLDVLND